MGIAATTAATDLRNHHITEVVVVPPVMENVAFTPRKRLLNTSRSI
jgi:hypothetical protein